MQPMQPPLAMLHALLARYCRLQVIAPHPDDEVFGAAGLIQLAASQGMHIRVHIATDGEMCFGALPAAQEQALRQARRQESLEASRIVGYAPPLFWDLGDGRLSQQQSRLQALISQHHCRETLWVAPWSEDGHPDHNATGQAVEALHVPALYYPIWALVDPPRLARFTASARVAALPLDADQLERKHRAALCFTSQFADDQRDQGRIIADQHLRHFVTEQEMYWHGH